MLEDEIQEIQLDIDSANETINLDDALTRLCRNSDFKKVILDDYFKEEAARLVEIKAAPQVQGPSAQEAILRAIDGIGQLQQHFNKIRVMASTARSAVEQAHAMQQELADELTVEGND